MKFYSLSELQYDDLQKHIAALEAEAEDFACMWSDERAMREMLEAENARLKAKSGNCYYASPGGCAELTQARAENARMRSLFLRAFPNSQSVDLVAVEELRATLAKEE